MELGKIQQHIQFYMLCTVKDTNVKKSYEHICMHTYACTCIHIYKKASAHTHIHRWQFYYDNVIQFFFISFQVMLKWHRESTRNLFWIISQLSNWVTLPSILLETKIWKSNQIFLTTIILDYKKILLKPQFFNMRM